MNERAAIDRIAREDEALERVEALLGLLLLTGVSVSTAILSAGLGFWLLEGPSPLSGRLLQAGLITLMATPAVRVIVSLVEFVRLRDWFFAAMCFAVVAILTMTLLAALGVA
jgi:uncharacterized membrane protein